MRISKVVARVVELGPDDRGPHGEPALDILEAGGIVVLPGHGFALASGERAMLDAVGPVGARKNVSFDPRVRRLGGLSDESPHRQAAAAMMRRFAEAAAALAERLLPDYVGRLETGRASFRPVAVAGRPQSPRKDDRRLHVDAFRASPVQGRRILRVFFNIDPEARPRVWEVGESFEDYARRFLPGFVPAPAAQAWLLQRFGLTRGPRTAYDEAMLRLHDRAKLDADFQAEAPRTRVEFPSGAAWLVFTDATPHAALSGRFALEQTFLAPVEAMRRPELSPLRILERLAGRSLA